MAVRSLNSGNVLRRAYRGWTLYVRWYPLVPGGMAPPGWIVKPIAPGERVQSAISLGRYRSSDEAFGAGERAVDRKLDGGTAGSTGRRKAGPPKERTFRRD